ncbi:MAG: YXWGXW repeat-containing protein [Azoarcus sp.]|nr:YXWGXW repeat-containing protein [Azoarcus sp.]
MSRQTNTGRIRWSAPLIAALLLSGCVVAPIDRYAYQEEVVIVTPAPRIEYRGYPPVAGYLWIDGYWNRVGQRHHWVTGRWAPPPARYRAPDRSRDRDRDYSRDRDDDRNHHRDGDRDRKRTHDRDRGELQNTVQPNEYQANTRRRGSEHEQVQPLAIQPTRTRDLAREDRTERDRVATRAPEPNRYRNERNGWQERPRQQGETGRRGEPSWRTGTR